MVLLAPLDDRSLRSFQAAMRSLHEQADNGALPGCPECGGELNLRDLRYRFDEPALPILHYDPDTEELQLHGVAITSEQELVDAVERPFSPADLHRMQLGSVRAGAYLAGPGVVTAALRVEGDPTQMLTQAMTEARELLGVGGYSSSDGILPLMWNDAGGYGAWLGEPADRLRERELLVINLISIDRLLNDLLDCAEALDLQIDINHEDHEVTVSRGELSLPVDLFDIAALTVRTPLTLTEAAHHGLWELTRSMDCQLEVMGRLRADGYQITLEEDGTAVIAPGRASDKVVKANLSSVVRKMDYDVEQALESVRHSLAEITESESPGLGQTRACGCTPLLTLVARAAEWVSAVRADGQALISRPVWDGVEAVLVEDCRHSVRFVPDHPSMVDDAHEALQEAERNLPQMSFDARGRAVRDVHGETFAVIWAGHNVASVALDERLVRGLARQEPALRASEEIYAISLTRDLLVLLDPTGDPELLATAMAAAQRDLHDSPFEVSTVLPGHVELRADGDAAGIFNTIQF